MIEPRRAAIAGEGAEVVVVHGGYDDAVRVAAADAADPACRVLADADHDGSSPVPGWVIEGYATLFAEARQKLLARACAVDVVMLQTGVGALAAAGVRWAAAIGAAAVAVDPAGAPCIAASLAAGPPGRDRDDPHDDGRASTPPRPSRAAWPTLAAGAGRRRRGRRRRGRGRAAPAGRPAGWTIGESGAAGVAGLVALGRDPAAAALRERVGLGAGSVALAIATEGPTGR